MEQTLIVKLLSRIEFKEYYPSKNKKKEKKALSYFFVSTKVVSYKDNEGVMQEALVGVTYRKHK